MCTPTTLLVTTVDAACPAKKKIILKENHVERQEERSLTAS